MACTKHLYDAAKLEASALDADTVVGHKNDRLEADEPESTGVRDSRYPEGNSMSAAEYERAEARADEMTAALAAQGDVATTGVPRELLNAAIMARDDLKMRADMGAFDGDHTVQMGDGIWCRFCDAIDAAVSAVPR